MLIEKSGNIRWYKGDAPDSYEAWRGNAIVGTVYYNARHRCWWYTSSAQSGRRRCPHDYAGRRAVEVAVGQVQTAKSNAC
jgi:hypothetical protein